MKIKKKVPIAISPPPSDPLPVFKSPVPDAPKPTDSLRVLLQMADTEQPHLWFVGRDPTTDLPIVFHEEKKAVASLQAVFEANPRVRYRLIRIVKEWR